MSGFGRGGGGGGGGIPGVDTATDPKDARAINLLVSTMARMSFMACSFSRACLLSRASDLIMKH